MKRVILTADQPTVNGRIYPKGEVERAVARWNSQFGKEKPMCCSIVAPFMKGQKGITQISHFVDELRLEGNQLIANSRIADTEHGLAIQDLLDGKHIYDITFVNVDFRYKEKNDE